MYITVKELYLEKHRWPVYFILETVLSHLSERTEDILPLHPGPKLKFVKKGTGYSFLYSMDFAFERFNALCLPKFTLLFLNPFRT